MGLLRKGRKPESPASAPEFELDPEYTRERLLAMYETLSRSIYDSNRKCPWCSKEINIAGPLCRECNRPAPRPMCPRCHSPLYVGAKVCWGCKWKIDQVQAMRAALEGVLRSTLAIKKAATGKKLPGR